MSHESTYAVHCCSKLYLAIFEVPKYQLRLILAGHIYHYIENLQMWFYAGYVGECVWMAMDFNTLVLWAKHNGGLYVCIGLGTIPYKQHSWKHLFIFMHGITICNWGLK